MPGTAAISSTWGSVRWDRMTSELNAYVVQCLLGLNLSNGDQSIVGLQKVIDTPLTGELAYREFRAESTFSLRGEFGRRDELAGVICSVEKWHAYTMGTGIKSSFEDSGLIRGLAGIYTHA